MRPDSSLQSVADVAAGFLDDLGLGIILSESSSGVIHYISKYGAALLSYTAEELIARKLSFLDLTHPDDRERSAAEHRRLMAGETDRCSVDRRYIRKCGTIVWARLVVTLVDDAKGGLRWRTAVLEEMTKAEVLQLQLANAAKLAGMVTWSWATKSGDAILSGDTAFGAATPAKSAFDAVWEAINASRKTLRHVHPDDRRAVESTVNRALASQTGYSIEYRVIDSDGAIRHLRGSATCLVDEAGEVTHLIGTNVDITDEKSRQTKRLPDPIRRILKHIDANWNKPIYLNDLARNYGIAARAIQRHFASQGLMPLTKYVKQLRLRHAHQRLCNPKPGTSVAAVALYCGFQNLGHFSRDYRQEFGELPSATLKAARLPRKAP